MRTSLLLAALGVACLPMLSSNPAHAQATRTWVSGVGDDVNPCSRTAPCKTFAGAISKTAVNGEINCLDPAGYGAVTITKSITIDCEDTQGSILASLTTGVIINITAATDTLKKVRLRGISINGAANGIRGINFLAGNALILDEMFIHGFTNEGVLVSLPTGATAELHMKDTTVADVSGTGVQISTAGTAIVQATLTRVQLLNNNNGLRIDGVAGSSGQIRATVRDSIAASNTTAGFAAVSSGAFARIAIYNSTASNNGTGLLADQPQGGLILSGVSSVHNGTGISTTGGAGTFTYNNNFINGNITTDGVPTTPLTPH
jgi:hypothetical protein